MGSPTGAAKARAAFLARVAAGDIVPTGKARTGVVVPFVPAQSVYLPPQQLAGRVCIMLATHGPLTAPELAARCGVSVEEIDAVAWVLRGWVEALRVGSGWLLYSTRESGSVVWEARARLLAQETEMKDAA